MFLIVDIIVIAIFALCILLGYKRGLTGCIIKILSFFIALIISLVLFKPASIFVINNTQIDENIQSSIVQFFEKEEANDDVQENNSMIVEYISKEIKNNAQQKKNEIVESAAHSLSINIVNIITFIALFILARIALIFVKALSDLITDLPLIKQCDKIGGIIYGILQSLLIIFIAFAVITFISTILKQNGLLNLINSSYIGSILYNNNILLQLFF